MNRNRTTLSRRTLALAGLLLLPASLGACGFHPLYEDTKSHPGVSEQLKRVYVAGIPERFGQLVRLSLQSELAGADPEHPDGYTLQVNPSLDIESVDIHQDNTSGRVRIIGRAHWALYTVEQYPKFLAQGDASTLDGMGNTFEQYFAQSLNLQTVQTRVAKTLAEDVTQQLAIWFETHAPTEKSNRSAPVYYQTPNAMPNSSDQQPVEKSGADGIPALATGRLELDDDNSVTGQ